MMDNLFRTDGIRGLAQIDIKPDLFFDLGTYLALKADNPILVCCDTRETGKLYKRILISAITSYGKNVYDLDIGTTPALAYLCRQKNVSFGIMITASHNPYQYNGIKVFDSNGQKIDKDRQLEISNYLSSKIDHPHFYPVRIGHCYDKKDWLEEYLDHVAKSFSFSALKNANIIADPANGGATWLMKKCFDKLGFANIIWRGNHPNGININADVGTSGLNSLKDMMKEEHCNIGVALDGDGDRFSGVLFDNIIDGEKLTYLLILNNREEYKSGVVSTPETNRSLVRFFLHNHIPYYESQVGDSNVYNLMQKTGCAYGFEPAGHLLFADNYSDGLISMLKFLALYEHNSDQVIENLTKLKLNHLSRYTYQTDHPQEFIQAFSQTDVKDEIKSLLKAGGRLTLRPSGTEDVLRVNFESRSKIAIKKSKKLFDTYFSEYLCAE